MRYAVLPLRFVVLLGLAAVFCGCSDSAPSRLKTIAVKGKLSRSGTPLGGAQVMLHPAASSSEQLASLRPNAITAPDGTFVLTTYEQGDGAPEGSYQVTVHWPDESYQPRTPEEREEFHTGGLKPDKLQGRFKDPATSGLTVTVSPTTTELPLELPW